MPTVQCTPFDGYQVQPHQRLVATSPCPLPALQLTVHMEQETFPHRNWKREVSLKRKDVEGQGAFAGAGRKTETFIDAFL